MSDVSRDDLSMLRETFAAIEDEISTGSIVEARRLAETGQHNVDQLLDGVSDSEHEDTEE